MKKDYSLSVKDLIVIGAYFYKLDRYVDPRKEKDINKFVRPRIITLLKAISNNRIDDNKLKRNVDRLINNKNLDNF